MRHSIHYLYLTLIALVFSIFSVTVTRAENNTSDSPRIVSSIYPLQQISQAITGKSTQLIADTALSPHDYSLKPKDIETINQADLVIWIGDIMMPNLSKAIHNKNQQSVITISKLAEIQLLSANHQHEGSHHEGHHHHHHKNKQKADYDPHLWLSPHNAKVIAKAIKNKLQTIDIKNKATYEANYIQFTQQLEKITKKIQLSFHQQKLLPYYTFHNAYQYFEKAFHIQSKGAIKSNAQQSVKTKDFIQLTHHLKTLPQACIFKEPQFELPLLKKFAKQPNLKVLSLDPIGYNSNKANQYSPNGYIDILNNLYLTIHQCQ